MKQKNGCMNVVEDKKSEKAFVRRDNVLSDSRKVKRIYGKEMDMVSLDTNETFNISTISTPNVSSLKLFNS